MTFRTTIIEMLSENSSLHTNTSTKSVLNEKKISSAERLTSEDSKRQLNHKWDIKDPSVN
jgi:hypothetical protein